MPGSFVFSNAFDSTNLIALSQFGQGGGNGVDDANAYHALGGRFHFENNATSIAPIMLRAGETLRLDVDFGMSNNVDPIDTEIRIIDAFGRQVAANDAAPATDKGSPSTNDPRLNYTAASAGLYYVVVSQHDNDYIDGQFAFTNTGSDAGLFQLDVSFDTLQKLYAGSDGDDTVFLLKVQRRYDAGEGDDFVATSDKSTAVDGGAGDDVLQGGKGNDSLFGGKSDDTLTGMDGSDLLAGGEGNDMANGRGGNDQLFGGEGQDRLAGSDGRDALFGEADLDILSGDAGNDTLFGGDGADVLDGGAGNDQMFGGAGRDSADYFSVIANVRVNLALATPQNTLGAGIDSLQAIEDVTGSMIGNDTISGNGVGNSIFGNGGNDWIVGGGGGDVLFGGSGKDTVRGGTESDAIHGEAEGDSLFGGDGGDIYYYDAATDSTVDDSDFIGGFSHLQSDRISLDGIFGGTLKFIGAGAFSGTPAEVRVIALANGDQAVLANLQGDAAADFRIVVRADATLVQTDFFL